MKHTTFASPALVMYSMIPPAILFLVPFIISCVSLRVQNILMIISAFISMSAIISIILRHAFVLVSYGQHGIATRHLSLAFEDIHYATTIDVEILKYSLLPTITIKLICIGQEKSDCSFWHYNKNECILLPANSKTIHYLKEYSGQRSHALCILLSSLQKSSQ